MSPVWLKLLMRDCIETELVDIESFIIATETQASANGGRGAFCRRLERVAEPEKSLAGASSYKNILLLPEDCW